jgi:hypothetical protein
MGDDIGIDRCAEVNFLAFSRTITNYERSVKKDVLIPGIFGAQLPLFPAPHNMRSLSDILVILPWLLRWLWWRRQLYGRSMRNQSDCHGGIARNTQRRRKFRRLKPMRLATGAANWILEIVRSQKIEVEMKEIEPEEKLTEMEVRANSR